MLCSAVVEGLPSWSRLVSWAAGASSSSKATPIISSSTGSSCTQCSYTSCSIVCTAGLLLLDYKCCCVTCWQASKSCCIKLRSGRQSPLNSRQRRQAQSSCRSSPALSVLQCSSEARRRPWRRVSTKPHSSSTASTLSTCRHRDDNCSFHRSHLAEKYILSETEGK